jgi:hypothetical protein
MGVEYLMNATSGSGNNLVANNDDEYGAGPYCRFDDDGEAAGNEWSGAWLHTNPIDGEFGYYQFEISRPLATLSTATDAQLAVGGTYEFGIAFWDPFETDNGWTGPGHYVTGCSSEWTKLIIEEKGAGGSGGGRFSTSPTTIFAAAAAAAVGFMLTL